MNKPNYVYLGIGLLSAATLAFELVLTRLFALAQGYHFAFMAVSLALLGAGASGTVLAVRPPTPQNGNRRLVLGAGLCCVSVPASYLLVNVIPFDAYRIAWESKQLLWLAAYYLALTVPFFFSGLTVGTALVAWPRRVNRLYAANLIGSSLGLPLGLLALVAVGGPAAVFGVAALAGLAFLCLAWGRDNPSPINLTSPHAGRKLSLLAILWIGLSGLLFVASPPFVDVHLTPYQPLSQALLYPGSRIVAQQWNAFSRVDIVESEGMRSAPGLSMSYPDRLPPQLGLSVDAQNLSPITQVQDSEAEFTAYIPVALALQLRPDADVLVVEPGGGLAVLAALHAAPRSVTVLHSNPAAAAAVDRWGQSLYADPRLTLVVDDLRSYLRREDVQFDLILFPITDSFRPVTAGAYALGEDYRYTLQSFAQLWDHLSPNGLLVAERWLQLPPSESLRLWGIVVQTLNQAEVDDPGSNLLALRSLQTSLILVSRVPLTDQELETGRHFARTHQLDLIWSPALCTSEYGPLSQLPVDEQKLGEMGINRYNVVPGAPYYTNFSRLVTDPASSSFFADYPYAVHPPTDDRPFFFHFFKWRQIPQILASLGKSWQPFGGSGYLVLVLLLGLLTVLSAILILLPLVLGGRRIPTDDKATRLGIKPGTVLGYLVFFSCLGLGFLLVEISLIQRFIAYLGQPAYAFATVLGGLLLASGVGSRYLSRRIPLTLGLLGIASLSLAYPVLLDPVFDASFFLPLMGRIIVSVTILMPLGLLLGTPFPRGLDLVRLCAPGLLPWVWAVNGCASVLAAVLASMLAIDFGFGAVMRVGAGAYLVALLVSVLMSGLRTGDQPITPAENLCP